MNLQGKTYHLKADGNSIVSYTAPDGRTYLLNPNQDTDDVVLTYDQNQRPVMAYRPGSDEQDGELIVSLAGAPSLAATLLHYEDDTPRKYYYATDSGNARDNPLNRRSFRLRLAGHRDCPVIRHTSFKIMVVK